MHEEGPTYERLKKLVFLALVFGTGDKEVEIRQKDLALKAGVSQQTVSRLLRELELMGAIKRLPGAGRSHRLVLTERGMMELRALRDLLSLALEGAGRLVLRGVVVSGLGEGKYYLSIEHYCNYVKNYLGFRPYPGTLNVKLLGGLNRSLVIGLARYRIPEFSDGMRTYGSALLVPCRLNGHEPCALIFPSRTHHSPDIIEVISPFYLRGLLNLRDGDEVTVEVEVRGGSA